MENETIKMIENIQDEFYLMKQKDEKEWRRFFDSVAALKSDDESKNFTLKTILNRFLEIKQSADVEMVKFDDYLYKLKLSEIRKVEEMLANTFEKHDVVVVK